MTAEMTTILRILGSGPMTPRNVARVATLSYMTALQSLRGLAKLGRARLGSDGRWALATRNTDSLS